MFGFSGVALWNQLFARYTSYLRAARLATIKTGILTPYLVHTPAWLKWLYPSFCWQMPAAEKKIYLSFDDGPHPDVTPFVLDQLARYQAKASFFCIGKNVEMEPLIYGRIKKEGHSIGNHTYSHKNGWKTDNKTYLADVQQAHRIIDSNLFRPPYGRITRFQAACVREILGARTQIIMWTLLSADFDQQLSGEQCLEHVVRYARPGSIIVMHDSQKAWPRLQYALPRMLQYFDQKGWEMAAIAANVEK